MFRQASAFTGGGLNTWDTSSAQRMNGMFWDASSFNADLSGWDTADVTVMGSMFRVRLPSTRISATGTPDR